MSLGPGLPGSTLEAYAEGFDCGLVGTIGVSIDDGDGNNVLPRTTANIVEIECIGGVAVYRYLGVYPSDPSLSPYLLTWDDTVSLATEEVLVSTDDPTVISGVGPCTDWIEAADVVDCCSGVVLGSDNADALAVAASNASEILFELSGRRFRGLCGPLTVRPCRDACSCFPGIQRLAYAGGGDRLIDVGWSWGGDYWWNGRTTCGCGCLSQVLLSGYPVQGISQVKIDGEIVPPSEYRLDEKRYLTRKNGNFWPACQDLSLDDDQPGTFSVSYWYGAPAPGLAQSAAAELACQLYRLCSGMDDCVLPTNVSRTTRLGVTTERFSVLSWFYARNTERGWQTGMTVVDAFLSAFGSEGQRHTPKTWSPDGRQFARPLS